MMRKNLAVWIGVVAGSAMVAVPAGGPKDAWAARKRQGPQLRPSASSPKSEAPAKNEEIEIDSYYEGFDADEGPILGGHRFIIGPVAGNPFIVDQATMSFGAGVANFA